MKANSLGGAIAFHDRLAEGWEARYKTDRFAERLQVLSELLPEPQNGKRWLDAGCGTGAISRWLAHERGASVVALDASSGMLASAPKSSGVEFVRGDVTCIGLPDNAFDGVVCSSVLEYLSDPALGLKEFRRLVRPGGIVLLSVPNSARLVRTLRRLVYWMTRPFGPRRRFAYLDHSTHCFSEKSFAELLRANGFELSTTRRFGKFFLPFGFSLTGTLLMGRCSPAGIK